jgi:hypothetical protein
MANKNKSFNKFNQKATENKNDYLFNKHISENKPSLNLKYKKKFVQEFD